jgi:hypothetical protein
MEHHRFLALHVGLSKRVMATIVYIWSFDRFYGLTSSGSLSCSTENELSCDCLGGCGVTTCCLAAYTGCQNCVYGCLRSCTTKITQDSRTKTLSLCWRSLSRWGRESVAFSFAKKGGQYNEYRYQWVIHILITRLTGQKIVNTPLRLILAQAYLHYATIHFSIEHPLLCFGTCSIIFMYVFIYHYIVL